MCTSIVVNKRKTIVGFNLDLLDMERRVREADEGVYIEINDPIEGWMPLFGANASGNFVGMPTCWPHDARSDKQTSNHVILLDMDFLLGRKTLPEIKALVDGAPVCSVPGLTFMGVLSDRDGNVLHVVPGQGNLYYERPDHKVLTNFSPFKMDSEKHPWMGWDRYQKAEELLSSAPDDYDVQDGFAVLRAVSQTVCPTVVSMVFDVGARTVYWCLDRDWDHIHSRHLEAKA